MDPRHVYKPWSRRSSIRTRLAYRFLRALKKLNQQPIRNGNNTTTTSRRYLMVRKAAYESMAYTVGSKRAWSRALLWKIRKRGLSRWLVVVNRNMSTSRRPHRALISRGRRLRSSTSNTAKVVENPSKGHDLEVLEEEEEKEGHQELRGLVPGGEVMDVLSLFDETAHYIECLTAQVQIMRNILDFNAA